MQEIAKCPLCDKKLKHLHDAAHGIHETHLFGTERFECQCGFECWGAVEGEKLGLKFILDV